MNNSKKLKQLYSLIDAIQQIQTSSTRNIATTNLKGSLMQQHKNSTDDATQSQHHPQQQKSKIVHSDRQKEPAPLPNTTESYTKNDSNKLFTFLPQMTSARPFVSHQNRWEQINDINTQYIKKVTNNHTSKHASVIKNPENFKPQPPSMSDGREWVNSPQHYNPGTYETWKIINEYELDKDFYLGTALRYILRAGKKHNNKFAEDLRKAIWYLDKRATMWENDNEL
jgi:hypothetical protein